MPWPAYVAGYRDFFQTFRGQECVVVFRTNDPGDSWIAPLNEDGSHGEAFADLTEDEETSLMQAIDDFRFDDASNDYDS